MAGVCDGGEGGSEAFTEGTNGLGVSSTRGLNINGKAAGRRTTLDRSVPGSFCVFSLN